MRRKFPGPRPPPSPRRPAARTAEGPAPPPPRVRTGRRSRSAASRFPAPPPQAPPPPRVRTGRRSRSAASSFRARPLNLIGPTAPAGRVQSSVYLALGAPGPWPSPPATSVGVVLVPAGMGTRSGTGDPPVGCHGPTVGLAGRGDVNRVLSRG